MLPITLLKGSDSRLFYQDGTMLMCLDGNTAIYLGDFSAISTVEMHNSLLYFLAEDTSSPNFALFETDGTFANTQRTVNIVYDATVKRIV